MDAHHILVCVAEHQWTLEALHLACALASDSGGRVTLVKMVPVGHPLFLGDSDAYWHYSPAEREEMKAFVAILETYDVPFAAEVFQYVSLAGAIVDAADHFGASTIFATLPHRIIPLWRRYELWTMRRQFRQRNCPFYTLETALETLIWVPETARSKATALSEYKREEHVNA